ncbi:uncharacterized protein F4807DRAFT_190225 [Annulohypoxylon truncatum]|uniref:uncharacterized protein n=1 Tax=Annulohypoxylon truncatum TaxID=327061 RepID=UPI0020074C17|nr:uncharacterized protein F4807DRAFT_190225 [Annulohypoxylon truncatum]KAI1207189.1 hypothetical protein F4807DRAFT_190225 [Annulohypoxylon truncatum]
MELADMRSRERACFTLLFCWKFLFFFRLLLFRTKSQSQSHGRREGVKEIPFSMKSFFLAASLASKPFFSSWAFYYGIFIDSGQTKGDESEDDGGKALVKSGRRLFFYIPALYPLPINHDTSFRRKQEESGRRVAHTKDRIASF